MIDNSKEKKSEQIFAEKFSPLESKNPQSVKPRKEIFPWLQETNTRQISIETKDIDELIAQKTRQAINSVRVELADYKSKLDHIASEKNQQYDVDLLRLDIVEYKSTIERLLIKKSSQSDVELLQTEIANYKSKLDLIVSEMIQRKDIDSIKAELKEYKSKLELVVSGENQKNDIASIRKELAECKSKLELVVSGENPKNDIALIRKELEEYKSKLNAMVDEITIFLEVINSINEEISRFKNNLGSVTLKQDAVL